ncbi:MAG: hypothetical protein JF603_14435 [Acidobacteria bacterium]|nr:hypothetical protein [Acidobacteriota bacterium]
MSLARKLLLAMFLVSLTGSAFGAGTFASFNATTTNAGSTFATGSLILSNTKQSATACMSSGGALNTAQTILNGNANASCDALFNALTANVPGATATVGLTLTNEGNVTGATGIKGIATACTNADTPGSGGATATVYHGSGDLCAYLNIQVQETTDATFNTPVSKCMYPVDASNACASVLTATLNAATVSTFYTATVTNNVPLTFSSASVAAGASRYVKITLTFRDAGTAGSENQYMGRYVSFGTQWTLTQ